MILYLMYFLFKKIYFQLKYKVDKVKGRKKYLDKDFVQMFVIILILDLEIWFNVYVDYLFISSFLLKVNLGQVKCYN